MALQLDNLRTVQDKTEENLAKLDARVTSLGKKLFLASSQTENLNVLLQLSVIEGVQTMYTNFHHVIKQHVQQKSHDEADDTIQDVTINRSSTRVVTKQDKAAVIWTSAFSEFYRAS